ncbi:M56 family metallopeptidase [Sphingomonas sp. BK235]|uniref:M56 family metallopeptidase n=1 Tax=Sphingomonas sp. BK235 TaxID=2512131 RepID=UPI001044D554|nr:M56 family metallopeptidase [Sphingomonas sp. BK235]TCP34922.1 beta-lactamase regulating signal transducer with metallopeptidase domain [Sphingomonas sp. BK235]
MIGWAMESLLASGLLMGAVLVLRAPVRRAFGAPIAYALWAIPALRLLLPPLPAGWRTEALPALASLPAAEPIAQALDPLAALPALAPAVPSAWPAIVLGVWAAGVAALLLWQVGDYWRFRYRLLRHGIALDRIGGVTIVQSAAANGPVAFGVFDRVVAFPCDFAARFDADERALALEHELGHHRRGDLVANWIALGVLALHWFNPLAWVAFRAFRADQEMANDAGVLARLGGASRHAYGCAIVKAAHGRAVTATCHLHTVKDLKGRLRMLSQSRASRSRTLLGVCATAAIALGALGLTASGSRAAERMRGEVEDATGIDAAALAQALPLPPAAPAAPAVPAAPTAPAAPDAPAVPVVPAAPHHGHRVTIVRDGHTTTYEGQAAADYLASNPVPVPPVPPVPPAAFAAIPPVPPVPAVTSRRCGGEQSRFVMAATERGQRVTVICTDHVERAAREASRAAVQARGQRDVALRSALASLEQTRAHLAANRDMPAEARRDAVQGIEEAIREMRDDMRADRDGD